VQQWIADSEEVSCPPIFQLRSNEMSYLKVLFVSLMVAVLLSAFPIAAQEEKLPEFDMKLKLEYSKNILDGLVTEDFEKISKGAKSLNALGKRKWLENESADYRTQNQVFWFTAGTLALAAEQKNIDAATLSYTQMTHSCINCHKLLRKL
jgi:hypothetical protein